MINMNSQTQFDHYRIHLREVTARIIFIWYNEVCEELAKQPKARGINWPLDEVLCNLDKKHHYVFNIYILRILFVFSIANRFIVPNLSFDIFFKAFNPCPSGYSNSLWAFRSHQFHAWPNQVLTLLLNSSQQNPRILRLLFIFIHKASSFALSCFLN